MCAYGSLNGPYACESEYLLKQVLRGEWKFERPRRLRLRLRAQGHRQGAQRRHRHRDAGHRLLYNPPSCAGRAGHRADLRADDRRARRGDAADDVPLRPLRPRRLRADDNLIDKPGARRRRAARGEQGIVLLQNRDARAAARRQRAARSLAVIGERGDRVQGRRRAPPTSSLSRSRARSTRSGRAPDRASQSATTPARRRRPPRPPRRGADAAVVFVDGRATRGLGQAVPATAVRADRPLGARRPARPGGPTTTRSSRRSPPPTRTRSW